MNGLPNTDLKLKELAIKNNAIDNCMFANNPMLKKLEIGNKQYIYNWLLISMLLNNTGIEHATYKP